MSKKVKLWKKLMKILVTRDGELLESYYTRFCKMMNESVRNKLKVDTMQKQTKSTRSYVATRNKSKEIIKAPLTSPESDHEEENDEEQTQRDKEIQKAMAIILKTFKNSYKPTNNNLRTSSNTRNKNEFKSANWVKEFAYRKEMIMLCKQEEVKVQLSVEKHDWLINSNDEPTNKELEAHYMYMAKILEDSELKEEALRNKAIMEGLINEDVESNDEDDKRHELHGNETHELPVCNIRRFEMIKYSFRQDEEYVAVKENEYEDLTSTTKDTCRAYQEIFRMMDEGWMTSIWRIRSMPYDVLKVWTLSVLYFYALLKHYCQIWQYGVFMHMIRRMLGLRNVLISCMLMLFSFGVDAVEDFKEYTLRDYYCWLNTYCCWCKLKLLDNAADIKLRLPEESVAADEKMKK
nr:hypothetical protein [Tanacetum cinerariifolium]